MKDKETLSDKAELFNNGIRWKKTEDVRGFIQDLKEEFKEEGPYYGPEVIRRILERAGEELINHSPQNNKTVGEMRMSSSKRNLPEDTRKGCGLNMGSYGIHGDLICGEKDTYGKPILCPTCSKKGCGKVYGDRNVWKVCKKNGLCPACSKEGEESFEEKELRLSYNLNKEVDGISKLK